MSRNHRSESKNAKVELKYCEHCGALWVREAGMGVYCAKCEVKVADLPVPKKRSGRVQLPKQESTVADGIKRSLQQQLEDMEAVGGVA
jgi:hypothetical protein